MKIKADTRTTIRKEGKAMGHKHNGKEKQSGGTTDDTKRRKIKEKKSKWIGKANGWKSNGKDT